MMSGMKNLIVAILLLFSGCYTKQTFVAITVEAIEYREDVKGFETTVFHGGGQQIAIRSDEFEMDGPGLGDQLCWSIRDGKEYITMNIDGRVMDLRTGKEWDYGPKSNPTNP
jgi:hypothetical protein